MNHKKWYDRLTQWYYYIWIPAVLLNILWFTLPTPQDLYMAGTFFFVGIYGLLAYASYRTMNDRMKEIGEK